MIQTVKTEKQNKIPMQYLSNKANLADGTRFYQQKHNLTNAKQLYIQADKVPNTFFIKALGEHMQFKKMWLKVVKGVQMAVQCMG